MRRDCFSCRTVILTCFYPEGDFFRHLRTADYGLFSTQEIARSAFISFGKQPELRRIHKIAVHLINLQQGAHDQLDMFETDAGKKRRSMAAVDAINDRYGEQAVYFAPAHGSEGRIDDSISFGSTGDVRQLYEEESAFNGPSTDEVHAEQPPITAE